MKLLVETLEQTRRRTELPQPRQPGRRAYLLVFQGDSSTTVNLPHDGEVLIGRDPESEVVLKDDGASRKHARVEVRGGQVWLADLGSMNGTRLNGQRITGELPLAAGDSVVISDCTLVLHCGASAPHFAPLRSIRSFRATLDAELERATSHEHSFALACVRLGSRAPPAEQLEQALGQRGRPWDVAAISAEQLWVLLPEVEVSDAPALVDRLVEVLEPSPTPLQAGYSMFPRDGADAETLMLAARQAADAARAGGLESADQSARELKMGKRPEVLVADPSMIRVYELLERLGKSAVPLPVLISGETGSGKENAAYAVHWFSPRAQGPFVSLNCGGIAESLLEGELFGFEKGAFTGAVAPKVGLLEAGHGGTVFLDEVGELSAGAQASLLRVLENKTLTRLGSVKERAVDIRIVAATHRDLRESVKSGAFREDLYFRLAGALVVLPPLRERPREIALLARRFAQDACRAAQRELPALSARAMAVLAAHAWPGNVRELKNAIEYAVATGTGLVLEPWHLPSTIAGEAPPPKPSGPPPQTSTSPKKFGSLAAEIRELERTRILEALEATDGVQTRAAELIGMPRRTFVLRLRELQINR